MYLHTCLLICLCGSFVESTVVTTNSGALRGVVSTTSDGTIHQFRKIPYANPPVGSRRFQKPVPVSMWNGTLDATQFGPSCIQYINPELQYTLSNPVVSEDCLFLNIYVPGDIAGNVGKSVMVFIHGGGFETGQGMLYDGSSLALYGDVIVVTLNYRLGVFGFLGTGDFNARGNYGLWDQIEALKWIKSNINYFGGNPDSVTIFGESAGAMSVSLLSIMPINKGFFHRIIMHSGSMDSFGGIMTESLTYSQALGRHLNCSEITNSASLLSCLRNIDALTLRNAASVVYKDNNGFGIKPNILPVIDGDLIPEHPLVLLQNESSANLEFYRSLDVISGCTSADGSAILLSLSALQDVYDFNISEGVPTKVLKEFYSKKVVESYFYNNTRILHPILLHYASLDRSEQGRQLINLFSDFMFYKPMMEALLFHKDRENSSSKTFQFIFSKTPQTDFFSPELPAWFSGAGQAAELGYLFDFQNYLHGDDYYLARKMKAYWTNFAKHGDPNIGQDVPYWPEYEHFIDFNSDITTGTNFLKKRMDLWLKIIPRIMAAKEVTKNTTLGLLRGLSFQYGNQKITQYRKVPFAHPPVGNLRFEKPVPFSSWQGVLDATSFGPSCMQILFPGVEYTLPNPELSEDCLHLNIYVPNEMSVNSLKSVMVYVHGGGFEFGQSMIYDGAPLALHGDVIVVTINYRLNVFGFLSTGDSSIRGNYGLWDQIEALKWIKSNIQLFGGNPESITICGESAGALSVSLLSILPRNKGLFHRVIMQSGSMDSFSLIATNPLAKVQTLGKNLNCYDVADTQLLAKCLRNIEPLALTFTAASIYTSLDSLTIKHGYHPVIDGDLIEKHPTLLLQNETSENLAFYQSLDVISGCTSYEGSLFLMVAPFFQQVFRFDISDGLPTGVLQQIVAPKIIEVNFQNMTEILHTIVENYTSSDIAEQGRMILNLIGDIRFYKPMKDALIAHMTDRTFNSKSFQYLFSKYQTYDELIGELPAWFDGAGHASELSYIFGDGDTLEGDDLDLSNEMKSFWTNFAKNGDPNVGQAVSFWPEFELLNQQYMDLDTNRSIKQYLFEERMNFWAIDIPKLIEDLYVTVDTNLGRVRGLSLQVKNQTIKIFRKVPYANPPVGNLRFRKPTPLSPWEGVLDATKFGPSCMQTVYPLYGIPNLDVSEDCLFLNIYVPHNISSGLKRSVMVFIHGGGYETGQGMLYDGTAFALEGDVVMVNINYRLGVFGFLSTGDSSARGNYGLWDQIEALKWIKSNIQFFGGNPDSITIFGESAGAFSVSHLSILPINKGLFHRVIMQSGSMDSAQGVMTVSLPRVQQLGRAFNCNEVMATEPLISCLRSVDAYSLRDTAEVVFLDLSFFGLNLTWSPVVDGELISAPPMILLQNKSSENLEFYQSLDVISGCTSAEGSLVVALASYLQIDTSEGIPTRVLTEMYAPKIVEMHFQNNTRILQPIIDKYSSTDIAEQGRNIVNLYGDIVFYKPMMDALQAHTYGRTSDKKTFQYLFSKYQSGDPLWPDWYEGAVHASELFYMFDLVNYEDDFELSSTMRSYWTNFARNGDPNIGKDVPYWPEYETTTQPYIDLNTNITIGTNLFEDRMDFWSFEVERMKGEKLVTVNTSFGQLQGISTQVGNRILMQFRKVPFAQPPLGNLRFKKPFPLQPWQGILDATKFGPSCVQTMFPGIEYFLPNLEISEDCLFLNIYVPNDITALSNKTVMVFIHGGSYENGQGMLYDGTSLALHGDVIVVTINYRLGVFGFLSTGDSSARGNYGLWDQIEALKWIKSNIQYFGGNPDSITIFGESAGAFSVSLLSILPVNKGLFHRVIMQSGSMTSLGGVGTNPLAKAKELARTLACRDTIATSKIVSCLRNADALTLRDAAAAIFSLYDSFAVELHMLPVVDGDLISADPKILLQSTSSKNFYQSLDIISGCTSAEGSDILSLADILQSTFSFNISDGIPTRVLEETFAPNIVEKYFNNDTRLLKPIIEKYGSSDMAEQGRQLVNFVGDFIFYKPMKDALLAHTSGRTSNRKSFQYLFSKYQPIDYFFGVLPAWFDGAGHGSEMTYIFGSDYLEGDDLILSDIIKSFWANFAKTGDPNIGLPVPNWPTYESSRNVYIKLDSDVTEQRNLFSDRMAFWSQEIPRILSENVSSGGGKYCFHYYWILLLLFWVI